MTTETKTEPAKLKWAVCDGYYAAETATHTFEVTPWYSGCWLLKVRRGKGTPSIDIIADTFAEANRMAERVN